MVLLYVFASITKDLNPFTKSILSKCVLWVHIDLSLLDLGVTYNIEFWVKYGIQNNLKQKINKQN